MTRAFGVAAACFGISTSLAGLAWGASTPEQRTAAETLFQQGRELMNQKSFAPACEKFAGSQELDPGLGTQLYLADCYDLAGKTASAWALFQEVSTAARRAGEPDRERIADERAKDLATRLSKVELVVEKAHVIAGLELRLNDVVIPRASWNTALPLDPGPLHIEARAPGKKPWHLRGAVEAGPASRRLEIPLLSDAPPSLAAANVRPVTKTSRAPEPNRTQRTLGYVTSGVGLVALAVGGFFGYRAYAANQKSKGECRSSDPNACTHQGVSLRNDAQRASTVATAVSIGGGVLAAGGLALILTSPSSRYAEAPRAAAALQGVSIGVRGVW
jgi:hypothetical protein